MIALSVLDAIPWLLAAALLMVIMALAVFLGALLKPTKHRWLRASLLTSCLLFGAWLCLLAAGEIGRGV